MSTRTETELIMDIKTGMMMTVLYKIPGMGSIKIIITNCLGQNNSLYGEHLAKSLDENWLFSSGMGCSKSAWSFQN